MKQIKQLLFYSLLLCSLLAKAENNAQHTIQIQKTLAKVLLCQNAPVSTSDDQLRLYAEEIDQLIVDNSAIGEKILAEDYSQTTYLLKQPFQIYGIEFKAITVADYNDGYRVYKATAQTVELTPTQLKQFPDTGRTSQGQFSIEVAQNYLTISCSHEFDIAV